MIRLSTKPIDFVFGLNEKYVHGATDEDIRHWLKAVDQPEGPFRHLDDQQLKVLREDFGAGAEERAGKAVKVLDWIKLNPHLPQPSLGTIYRFLMVTKNDEEKCKARLEKYFRAKATNEVFWDRNLTNSATQLNQQQCHLGSPPTLTAELHRVFYMRLTDFPSDQYDPRQTLRRGLTITDLFLHFDFALGVIAVIDCANFTFQHLLVQSPAACREAVTVMQDVMPIRIKEIHFLNCSPAMDVIFAVLKPFLSAKFASRVFVHTASLAKFHNSLPPSLLLEEYGGGSGTLQGVQEQWNKSIEENWEWLENEEKMVKETYQGAQRKNVQFNEGTELFDKEGSFRKLDID